MSNECQHSADEPHCTYDNEGNGWHATVYPFSVVVTGLDIGYTFTPKSTPEQFTMGAMERSVLIAMLESTITLLKDTP